MQLLGKFKKALRASASKAERSNGNVALPIKVFAEHGHFYSPLIDPEELKLREESLWPSEPQMLGIDWNFEEQDRFTNEVMASLRDEFDYPETAPEDPSKYYYRNDFFDAGDGFTLFSMLRHLQPKRMVEIGSGWSSLLTADVNTRFLGSKLEFTCIEPYPREFLRNGVDGISNLIVRKVEEVPLSTFEGLGPGDILFIDTSHVSKTGSDVNFIYFQILPRLKKGVVIHVHDIFFPNDYPKNWVLQDARSWNEQYILQALLTFSKGYKVLFGVTMMFARNAACLPTSGGSFWMEKTVDP